MTANFLFVLTIGLSAWYIWDSLRCKEISRRASAQACRNAQVQFLDDTVAVLKLGLARSSRGRLQVSRLFVFEFTADGIRRHQGRVYMSGPIVERVDMDPYPV